MWPLTISERPPPLPRALPTVIGRPSQWCQGGIIGWSRSARRVGLPLVDLGAEVGQHAADELLQRALLVLRCSDPGARSTETVSKPTSVRTRLDEVVGALGDVGVQRADEAGVEVR